MKELLYAMVEELVEDKSAIEITVDAPTEDGTTVYVNYGTADCQVGSVTVPARDYLVERGGSQ